MRPRFTMGRERRAIQTAETMSAEALKRPVAGGGGRTPFRFTRLPSRITWMPMVETRIGPQRRLMSALLTQRCVPVRYCQETPQCGWRGLDPHPSCDIPVRHVCGVEKIHRSRAGRSSATDNNGLSADDIHSGKPGTRSQRASKIL